MVFQIADLTATEDGVSEEQETKEGAFWLPQLTAREFANSSPRREKPAGPSQRGEAGDMEPSESPGREQARGGPSQGDGDPTAN